MAYYRDCVPVGQEVTLRAIFTDGCGKPIDVDATFPDVYLYAPDNVPSDIDAEVTGGFATATASVESANVTKLATGYYEITYTVPLGTEAGSWVDIWHSEINSIETYSYFNFTAMERGKVAIQSLQPNSLIVILLSEDIEDTDGNSLGHEVQLTFSTTYTPYYASPDLLRLECGGILDGIPDDTLSLMIHWSSIESDAWSKGTAGKGKLFRTARTKFVTYDAVLRCLMLPADIGGKTKSLGDLMISNNSDFASTIKELKKARDEWKRVVNSGGTIVPGQSFAPSVAVKGGSRNDRVNFGREWHKPSEVGFAVPTQNAKFADILSSKYKFGFK